MGQSVFPAPAAGKTRYAVTLTSGTSWTVPAGVTYVNVTLTGGGQGGSGCASNNGTGGSPSGVMGSGGQVISTLVNTTPGASITYAIGAGGSGGTTNNYGGGGGTTSFTGAISAGGSGGTASNGGMGGLNGGGGSGGGSGKIDIEYWL